MSGDVKVQDATATVLDDEEAVQQLKRQSRHGEEVDGNDHLAMVLKKGKPALCRIATMPDSLQASGNSAFRDEKPELQQFAVNLRCSPVGILC